MEISIYRKINIQEKEIKLLKVSDNISVCLKFPDRSHFQVVNFLFSKVGYQWILTQMPLNKGR